MSPAVPPEWTVKFQIGSDGKLQALGKIPNQ